MWIFELLVILALAFTLEGIMVKSGLSIGGKVNSFMGSLILIFLAYSFVKIAVLFAIVGKFDLPITTDLRIHCVGIIVSLIVNLGWLLKLYFKKREQIEAS